jgi:hypothetical protein
VTDRTVQPSALPAEFAERVSDPISYEDRVAWSRARDRYRKLERPTMPKIEHVLLDYSRHFLVVDGTRGPVEEYGNNPATHPAGYLRFRPDAYGLPEALKGKLCRLEEMAVEDVPASPSPKAEAHWEAFANASREAIDIVIGAYPEAKP